MRFVTRLLAAAYLIEAGLLLIIAPWTRLWAHNLFADAVPGLSVAIGSLFVRGGVTGVGIVTVVGGVRDLASLLFARPPADATAPPQSLNGPLAP
jgi:hypothetical protein